jgi:uncharacterized protein DUF6159
MAEPSQQSSAWRNVPDGRWDRSLFFLSHVWELFRGDRALMVVAAAGTLLNALAAAIIFGLVEWLFPDVGMRLFTGVTAAAVALPSTIASTYCNVALVRMAQARFEGRRCGARDGFRAANRRLGAIVAWSLLAVGVGAVLNWIAEKVPFAGALASWVAGAAWSLATMFAVPVLALEDAGARDAARRSAEIFRARWGEGIAGTVTVGFVTIVATVPGALMLVAGIAAGGVAGVALACAGGALVLGAISVSNAMNELFALAVYRFEAQGLGSFGFEPGQLDGFVDLKRRGPRR